MRKGLGKGLGKGLNALLPDEPEQIPPAESGEAVTELDILSVEPNPNQPRRDFDKDKLEALAASVSEHGVIQPIVVTKSGGGYTIVAGERRWRAARMAGLSRIPAVIKEYTPDEAAQIALIENLQREDLNPIEEAQGYRALLEDFHLTQETVSKRIGKSRSAVANSLRLLSLDEQIRELLIKGEITSGHARAILSLDDEKLRLALAKEIVEKSLNVRQAEALAKRMSGAERESKGKRDKEPDAAALELGAIAKSLSSRLGTKVSLSGGAKKGKIEIEYYGSDDLERILELLN